MAQINAPFTPEQVESLNGFQQSGYWHPFTCGGKVDGKDCRSILRATENGWVCDHCSYTQDWAHDFMANDKWREAAEWHKKLDPEGDDNGIDDGTE